MATILLSAAGAAIGGGFGGTVLGLSGAVIGRAVGATLGRAIDQRLLGAGSGSVETGRVDRFRLTSASEGSAVQSIWGRMRVSGQVIWASRFLETRQRQRGGKGAPRPTTTSYSYSVNLALALCEGNILRVGRVWADGIELDLSTVTMRVYTGGDDQLPDPKIAAFEGAELAPAYRGIAYVVFEDLQLAPFGNRVPQFSFEVVRPAQGQMVEKMPPDLVTGVRAVATIPGTGEYALATTPVQIGRIGSTASLASSSALTGLAAAGLAGETGIVNLNAPGNLTDFARALESLDAELPACEAMSLVVSWFGNDLRCGQCDIRPKVTDKTVDGINMPWQVSGLARSNASEVPRLDGKPVYGGTPADVSVVEAIRAAQERGKAITFYPFILMEQLEGNSRTDPWTGSANQPVLPWRGRITLSIAPGRDGSPDGRIAAEEQVTRFFGAAQAQDFQVGAGRVTYTGPDEWSLRRFILHYAHLCALAGGVDAFCIGSEMRGLTQIRGPGNSFPAVQQMRVLAADVRGILGAECKIGYAADWSEYFGYDTPEGDRYFHLDPLWADPNIDFVGIDNYMPLSDWREGEAHADAEWGSIYNLEYLKANIEGGEGYDWFYAGDAHRDTQNRTLIRDGAYGEDWLWRYKDIRNWWANAHHDRVGGVRLEQPTAWEPQSKPIWFTEFGCAAIDKGSNEPNKFLDPKSSESSLPRYSDGRRDELIQIQYLRAIIDYWNASENNPVSEIYGAPMIDMSKAHVWAWDARPYPQFPALSDLWSDGANYARGHWISGRAVSQPLANVVAEICERAGLVDVDVSGLYGVVRGYALEGGLSARGALQSLMLGYGFDAVERDGAVIFRMRDGRAVASVTPEILGLSEEGAVFETSRSPQAEIAGRVRLSYIETDGAFETRAVEAVFPDDPGEVAAASEVALALTRPEAQRIVERWLSEARVARDSARFALPPSLGYLGAGDVLDIKTEEGERRYRVDRVEQSGLLMMEAVRVEPGLYQASEENDDQVSIAPFSAPVTVTPVFLDLPLMSGQEDPYAPHLAIAASPWPGAVGVYSAVEDAGYALNSLVEGASVIGMTLTPLPAAQTGVFDRGPSLRVRLIAGELETVSVQRLLTGANLMAIGDGSSDRWELLQFMSATPVEPGVWDIGMRLRGQLGSNGLMPDYWPVGSVVVLLDGTPDQIGYAPEARGLARHFRIGSALRSYDDPSYVHTIQAFNGIGLRPLSPCHLKSAMLGADIRVSWLRRTRIGGDSWEGVDVPLGEAREGYLVRIIENGAVRRETYTETNEWTYPAELRQVDLTGSHFEIAVAQLSDVYGPGLFASLEVKV